eukprot:6408941-Amphidinium_carterae.1
MVLSLCAWLFPKFFDEEFLFGGRATDMGDTCSWDHAHTESSATDEASWTSACGKMVSDSSCRQCEIELRKGCPGHGRRMCDVAAMSHHLLRCVVVMQAHSTASAVGYANGAQ